MNDLQDLIDYLRNETPDINQVAIILRLLEKGGRATKADLVHQLTSYNDPVIFYYESVLAKATEMDLEERDTFTYDAKADNYFLNVSLSDTYLVETAAKLCRARINAWHDEQRDVVASSEEKLVRDRIPEIIARDGRTAITQQVSGEILRQKLLDKLSEEHVELLQDLNLNEISDMMEVLLALGSELGHDEEAVLAAVRQRRQERGGYRDGVYLKKVVSAAPTPK
jgi:predicted house-cleaning noncanonical NTP pyrophosphatase (MazG superfamily)